MIVLDTNVLIRFFTKDNLEHFKLAKKLLSSQQELFIPDVVFPEIYYVLVNLYDAKRSELVDIYHFLIKKDNLKTNSYMKKAIDIFEKTNLSIPDCIIAAQVKGEDELATFDKKLLNQGDVESYF